jgi:hypothetical protein
MVGGKSRILEIPSIAVSRYERVGSNQNGNGARTISESISVSAMELVLELTPFSCLQRHENWSGRECSLRNGVEIVSAAFLCQNRHGNYS